MIFTVGLNIALASLDALFMELKSSFNGTHMFYIASEVIDTFIYDEEYMYCSHTFSDRWVMVARIDG